MAKKKKDVEAAAAEAAAAEAAAAEAAAAEAAAAEAAAAEAETTGRVLVAPGKTIYCRKGTLKGDAVAKVEYFATPEVFADLQSRGILVPETK